MLVKLLPVRYMRLLLDKGRDNSPEGQQRLVDVDALARALLLRGIVRASLRDVLRPCQVHQVELPDLDQLFALLGILFDVHYDCEHCVRTAGDRCNRELN